MDSHLSISKLTTKLQYSKQRDTGMMTGHIEHWKRTESILKKKKNSVNLFSTRIPRIFNTEKSTFLTNCSSTTGYSYAIE